MIELNEKEREKKQDEYEKLIEEEEELEERKKELEEKTSDDQNNFKHIISQFENWAKFAVFLRLLTTLDLATSLNSSGQDF